MRIFGWEFCAFDETYEEFRKLKWKIIEVMGVSFGVSALGVVIVWQQWFAPHHIKLGLLLYCLSYIPLFYKIYITRKTWLEYSGYDYAYKFLKRQRYYFVGITILLFGALLLLLAEKLM